VTSEAETIKDQFLWALAESLDTIEIEYLVTTHDTIQAITDRMVASIPTVFLDLPIGPCHTTARLATWQGVSRQAIFQSHRAGHLLGFKHDGGLLVYPDLQFGATGRPLHAVRELLATATTPLTDAVQVAGWFRSPVDQLASTPLEILEASRRADAADRL
jgi:hypothetical protein